MRILLTGGCGFIGSNFVRHVLEEHPDVEVVNLDLLTYAGNLENLRDVEGHANYRFIRGDITDADTVSGLLEGGCDAILNFAAESHVDRSLFSSVPFVRTNVQGTAVLLDAAIKYHVKRFVQISTDEVYGQLGPDGVFRETTPLAPRNPYSASKAAADLMVQAYTASLGLEAVITRSSNNYGPWQYPEKFIPLFISNAMEDQPLPLYGDGKYVRDWLHVEDNCRGIWAALENGKPGETYNIGGGNERENLHVAREILKILGKSESLIRHVKDRPGHDRRYALDSARAQAELGWKPRIRFEEGLRATVDWYRRNEEWRGRVRSGEYRKYYEKQYGAR